MLFKTNVLFILSLGSNQTDCTSNPKEWETDFSKTRCPQEDWTVYAIVAIYMLFSNILLVNLVIAMFRFDLTLSYK